MPASTGSDSRTDRHRAGRATYRRRARSVAVGSGHCARATRHGAARSSRNNCSSSITPNTSASCHPRRTADAVLPTVKLLVTSRARLAVSGEWLMPLGGLAAPDVDETEPELIRAFDAVKLFELRAHAAAPVFDVRRGAADVAALVLLLDGMPLAIKSPPRGPRLPVQTFSARSRSRSICANAMGGRQIASAACARVSSIRGGSLNALEQQCLAQLSVFAAVSRARPPSRSPPCDCLCWRLLPTSRCCARTTTVASRCIPSCSNASDRLHDRRGDGAATALRVHRTAPRTRFPRSRRGPTLDVAGDGHRARRHSRRLAARRPVARCRGGQAMAPPLSRYFAVRGRTVEGIALLDRRPALVRSPSSSARRGGSTGTGDPLSPQRRT